MARGTPAASGRRASTASTKAPAKQQSFQKPQAASFGNRNNKSLASSSSRGNNNASTSGSAKKPVVGRMRGDSSSASSDSESESEEEEDEEEEEAPRSNGKKSMVSSSEEEEEDDEDDEEDEDEEEEEGSEESGFMDSSSGEEDGSDEDKEEDDDSENDDDEHLLTHKGEPLEEYDGPDYSSEEGEESENERADNESSDEEEEDEDGSRKRSKKPVSDSAQAMAHALASAESPSDVAERIKTTVAALANFAEYKAKRPSAVRSEMIRQLSTDCAVYYGYLTELVDMFLTIFSPAEMVEFLEANERSRPTCIRANTIKTSRRGLVMALTARGVGLEPVAAWSNVGLKILDENQVPIGATPEYLAGHYMLQSASSLTPVMALGPLPGERVLDMCASPGGKTTHCAQLMKNTGILVANDSKKPRIPALVANLARLGVRNSVCVNHDGRDFPKVVGGFDRVLLDAPCSGLGVIAHDPAVKQRDINNILTTAKLQKELLLAAIDATNHKSKTGGIIVYSTCSISVQENEQVVQYALQKRKVRIVDPELEFGRPGLTRWHGYTFHPSMKMARRYYPHVHNMDGFFVCKLVKYGQGEPDKGEGQEDDDQVASEEEESAKQSASDPSKPKPSAKALKNKRRNLAEQTKKRLAIEAEQAAIEKRQAQRAAANAKRPRPEAPRVSPEEAANKRARNDAATRRMQMKKKKSSSQNGGGKKAR